MEDVQRLAGVIRDNVQRVIVGKTDAIDLILAALLSRGHVLVEDVPGTGKTTMAKALAASLDCDFQRLQFTPDLVPADVLGVNVYDPQKSAFDFRPGPIFTQVFLADEINRATPRTQSALLEAMQEKQVSIDGVTTALPAPFVVLATLNPIEMEGTFPLPEAQLDRFMLRVSLGYPTPEEESAMLDRFHGSPDPAALTPVAGPEAIAAAQGVVDTVHVDQVVRDYILAIAEATRAHPQLRLGASPRASLALQHTAQARAAMDGRDYVMPDDIKALAGPVLSHRLVGDMSAQLRGINRSRIVADIVANTPVPIER
ncbi:MAG: MoxR family ATPase [Alphaproteobacteria bacterium]|nr:MoxR family ATPase [Alphaproteobacteria bacterium]